MGTHLCDEVVHQQAVGAEYAAGIGNGLGETADDEKPICRQFARIFSRWIVMWRKRARAPNLNTNGEVRVYTVMGKTNLNDAAWVCPTNAANRRDGVIAPYQVKEGMP